MQSKTLPDDFEPTSKDIICGRLDRTLAREHTGNRRLYVVAAMNLKAYFTAQTTTEKTIILNAIVDGLRESSPSGGFVEKDSKTGKWMTVDGEAARAKVGNTLRDALPANLKLQPKKTAEDTDRQSREGTESRILKAQEHCLAYALGKHDLKSTSDCLQEESPKYTPNGLTGGCPMTVPYILPHGLHKSSYPEGSLHGGLPVVLSRSVAIPMALPKYSKPCNSVNINELPRFLKHSYAISRTLPNGFTPSACDVICGDEMDKACHVGNRRFAALVARKVKAFSAAKTKTEQSRVVNGVVDGMRRLSPNGCFVKMDPITGKWMTVDDGSARGKVELAFCYALKAGVKHWPPEMKRQKNRTTQDANTQHTKDKTQQWKRDLKDTPSGCSPCQSPDCLSIDVTSGSPKISHYLDNAILNDVPLPHGFIPPDIDVICARVGKSAQQYPGNQNFGAIIARYLKSYSGALTKTDKSFVVQEVVDQMRKRSPIGGFVKKDRKAGKWIAVDDTTIRAKVSRAFRDSLSAARQAEAGKDKAEPVLEEAQSPPLEGNNKWDDPQMPVAFSSSVGLVMDFPFKAPANGNYPVFRMNWDAPIGAQPVSIIGTTATNYNLITSQTSTQTYFGPVNRVVNGAVHEARNKTPHREFAGVVDATGQLDVLATVASLLSPEGKQDQKLPATRSHARMAWKPRETEASNCADSAPEMSVEADAVIQKAQAIRQPTRISWTSQTTPSIDDDTLSYSSSVDDDADSLPGNSTQLEASYPSPSALLAIQQASMRNNQLKWSRQNVGAIGVLGTTGRSSPSKKRHSVEEERDGSAVTAVKKMRSAKSNDCRNTPEKGNRNGVAMESNRMNVRSQSSEEESGQWLNRTRPSSSDGNNRFAERLPPSRLRCVPLRESNCTRSTKPVENIPFPNNGDFLNYPEYIGVHGTLDKRNCVMCGECLLYMGNGSRKREQQSRHFIPFNNSGVCTTCENTVWVVVESDLEIKWCQCCCKFCPWSAFDDIQAHCAECQARRRECHQRKTCRRSTANRQLVLDSVMS